MWLFALSPHLLCRNQSSYVCTSGSLPILSYQAVQLKFTKQEMLIFLVFDNSQGLVTFLRAAVRWRVCKFAFVFLLGSVFDLKQMSQCSGAISENKFKKSDNTVPKLYFLDTKH